MDIESNYGLFIGGSFTEPTSGEFFKTINPATEEVLSEVAEAGQADVDAAVAAGRRAYHTTWPKTSGKDPRLERRRVLMVVSENRKVRLEGAEERQRELTETPRKLYAKHQAALDSHEEEVARLERESAERLREWEERHAKGNRGRVLCGPAQSR